MDAAVEALLRSAGVPDAELARSDPRVLGQAERATKSMAQLYDYVNTSLIEAISARGALGICHITGEARVLVDPQARAVIEASWKGGVSTVLVMKQRDPSIEDAETMLAAVQDDWHGITLADLTDILSLAREGALKIFVINDDPPVHFSLFGNDRILIQEPQRDETELKRVWYLESAELVTSLRREADQFVTSAEPLARMTFSTLLSWLGSPEIYNLLTSTGTRPDQSLSIPRVERDKLLRTGFLKVEGGRDLVRTMESGSRKLPSSRDHDELHTPHKLGSSRQNDSDSRVLVLQPSGYPESMARALSDVLGENGLIATRTDTQLITPDELRQALSHRRIVAVVASVGSAAETLHLLNFQSWESTRQAAWPQVAHRNLGPQPDIQVLVPEGFESAYFTRAVAVTYGAPIRFFAAESEESIRSKIKEVASVWARIEAASKLAENAPSGPGMDEQSRRAWTRKVRTWVQTTYEG